jgi:hypothetical protein
MSGSIGSAEVVVSSPPAGPFPADAWDRASDFEDRLDYAQASDAHHDGLAYLADVSDRSWPKPPSLGRYAHGEADYRKSGTYNSMRAIPVSWSISF